MADPGKHSEFSPEELDRLEDALERWTGSDVDAAPVPEDSLLAPPLRARLEDYRSLLTQVRAELPMEDVPDGLLAGVLAEARQHGRAGAETGAEASGASKPGPRELAGPGFWERLRRSLLLPGFALAGSAALLLWMVQPGDDGAPASLAQNDAPQAEARRLAPDTRPAPAAPQEPELEAGYEAGYEGGLAPAGRAAEERSADAPASPGQAVDAAPGQTGPAPAAAAPADAATGDVLKNMSDRADRKATTRGKKPEMSPIESYPGLDDVAQVDGDKEALRDTLEQADAARRKGRCGDAMSLYVEAMRMSGADSERAMARAGYGLCLMTQGDDTRADRYLEAARKLSPGVDAWVKRERGDSPAKKAPAKPSAKSKLDDPGF